MNKALFAAKFATLGILAASMAIVPAPAKEKEDKPAGESAVIATINGEPVTKDAWTAIWKADQWHAPVFKEKAADKDKMQGKPFEDYFFTKEVVEIRVMAQKYKDALPQMRSAIDDLYKRAKAGEDFATLAKQYSQDGSAANGGDLGQIEIHKFVFPFNRVALSMKEGEISEPVLTIFGYHIIKVDKVYPAVSSEGKLRSVQARHILIKYPSADARGESIALAKQAKVEVVDKSYCKKFVSYCQKED